VLQLVAASEVNAAADDLISIARRFGLNPKERVATSLLLQGVDMLSIARKMDTTRGSLKNRLTKLYDKVGANNRTEFTLIVLGKLQHSAGEINADSRKENHK
jgi:DNA-binding CsgD family transcriptional regulator